VDSYRLCYCCRTLSKGACLFFVLATLGCSGSTPQPATSPGANKGTGRSVGNPVMTCGAQESYEYVATRFRCADASNPFAGDARLAAAARRGSQQSPSSSHLVDAYEVPCASGPEVVYVDLYGCPEQERVLAELDQGVDRLLQNFGDGKFEAVIAECQSLGKDAPSGAVAWCLGLVPASDYALGRDSEGLSRISKLCAPLPPASPESDARAAVIALVMFCLGEANRTGHFERDPEQRSALMSSWLSACEVSESEVKGAFERSKQGG